MKLQVRVFGVARDILGGRTVELEVELKTVGGLRAMLLEKYPNLQGLRSLFIAVNQNYAPDEAPVQESDEIALIPPVSGG